MSIFEALQSTEAFLEWYKQVYGREILIEGTFAESRDISLNETIQPDLKQPQAQLTLKPRQGKQKQRNTELQKFYDEIKDCQKCALGKTRNSFVFGVGNPKAEIMFVGEAPGQEEDIKGLPFVGRAGKLLDKMLFAIGYHREDVFIANVLKCRPPKNRDPLPDEIVQCEPYLKRQLEMIQPKVLVALGRISGKVLLKEEKSLRELREHEQNYQDIPLIVTYHPAALLRNPQWKEKAWQDFKKIKKMAFDR